MSTVIAKTHFDKHLEPASRLHLDEYFSGYLKLAELVHSFKSLKTKISSEQSSGLVGGGPNGAALRLPTHRHSTRLWQRGGRFGVEGFGLWSFGPLRRKAHNTL